MKNEEKVKFAQNFVIPKYDNIFQINFRYVTLCPIFVWKSFFCNVGIGLRILVP
jgi:hypothetical protein